MAKQEKQLTWLDRLKKKDRIVVVDLNTYEEIRHFNFSALNLVVYILFFAILISISTWAIIAYTPIKQLIPGYPDIATQKRLAYYDKQNIEWIETQKEKLNKEYLYYKNLQLILSDSIISDSSSLVSKEDSIKYANLDFTVSKEDSMLRAKIEEQEKYLVGQKSKSEDGYDNLKGLLFFPPINGTVSDSMDVNTGHFGIDIIAPNNEAVKATLGGTVIFTDWTPNNGNVIHVQHKHNLVSVYKHNAVLLKKVGDVVKTGEPIAIIGNSGKLSTGPHLHLEIWYKGIPLDPLNHIVF